MFKGLDYKKNGYIILEKSKKDKNEYQMRSYEETNTNKKSFCRLFILLIIFCFITCFVFLYLRDIFKYNYPKKIQIQKYIKETIKNIIKLKTTNYLNETTEEKKIKIELNKNNSIKEKEKENYGMNKKKQSGKNKIKKKKKRSY